MSSYNYLTSCLFDQMFMRSQRLVQQISAKGRLAGDQEFKLTRNITSSLARSLQELSTNFRKGQSSYLRSKHAYLCFHTFSPFKVNLYHDLVWWPSADVSLKRFQRGIALFWIKEKSPSFVCPIKLSSAQKSLTYSSVENSYRTVARGYMF